MTVEPATDLFVELHKLTDRLSAARGIDNVLDEILSSSMALTMSEMGTISIISPSTGKFEVPIYRGFSEAYVEHMSRETRPVKDGPRERAFKTQRPVVIPNVFDDPAFEPFIPWIEEAGFISLQAVPIFSRLGEPLGALCTYQRDHHTPSGERLNLLDLYARFAADAIEREQVEKTLRLSEERFRHLHALTAQLNSIERWEDSLEQVLKSMIQLVSAEAGNIRLYEPPSGNLPIVAQWNTNPDYIAYFSAISLNRTEVTPSVDAIARQEPVYVEDMLTDPRFADHVEVVRNAGYRSKVALPLTNHAGTPLGAINVCFRDVRHIDSGEMQILELYAEMASNTISRLRHEAEQAETEQALREALSTKDQFLGMVSHELRTPMTMIRGLSSVLRRNSSLTKSALKEIYQDLGDSSERLYRLIENMLILARLEVGQSPGSELLLLDKLLLPISERLRGEIPDLKLELGDLPSDIILLGNRQYLEQIFRNLVENAHKYSSPRSCVEITADVDETTVTISVLDRGIGLKNAEEIFQPFQREAFAQQLAPGLGLGLAVCKMLLEAQGGRIWAESRTGGGTVFSFVLPRAIE